MADLAPFIGIIRIRFKGSPAAVLPANYLASQLIGKTGARLSARRLPRINFLQSKTGAQQVNTHRWEPRGQARCSGACNKHRKQDGTGARRGERLYNS